LLPKFGGAESETDCQDITPTISATASSKRGSPNNEEDDMNVPLKMIKRRIKIEKN
jgi:hypothetical protein